MVGINSNHVFFYQILFVSKLENKPYYRYTYYEEVGFFSNNSDYFLTPAEYPDFFEVISSMPKSNSQ